MGRDGETAAANDSRPESVAAGKIPREIKNLESSRGTGGCSYFAPSSRNQVIQDNRREPSAEKIDTQLKQIGPEDSTHASERSVENNS